MDSGQIVRVACLTAAALGRVLGDRHLDVLEEVIKKYDIDDPSQYKAMLQEVKKGLLPSDKFTGSLTSDEACAALLEDAADRDAQAVAQAINTVVEYLRRPYG